MAIREHFKSIAGLIVRNRSAQGETIRSPDSFKPTIRDIYYYAWFVAGITVALWVAYNDLSSFLGDRTPSQIDFRSIIGFWVKYSFPVILILVPVSYYFVQSEPLARRLRDCLWILESIFGILVTYILVYALATMFDGSEKMDYEATPLDPASWQYWWHYRYPMCWLTVILSVIFFTPPIVYVRRRFDETPSEPSSRLSRLVTVAIRIAAFVLAAIVLSFVTDMYAAAPPASMPENSPHSYLPQEGVPALIVALFALGGALAAFAILPGGVRIWSTIALWLLFAAALLVVKWWIFVPSVGEYSWSIYVRFIFPAGIFTVVSGAPAWLYLTRRFWARYFFKVKGRS